MNAYGSYFLLSHVKKFMFVAIAKNAVGSLKQTLANIEFGETPSDPHEFWGFNVSSFKEGYTFAVDQREELASYENYARFAVYRDPVERFMSCYQNKVLSPTWHPYYMFWKLEGLPLDDFITFAEKALCNPDPQTIDEHLRPQSRYYSQEDVQYIVPIQKLPIFLKDKFDIEQISRINTSDRYSLVTANAEQKGRIMNIYQEDYSLQPNY
jgi:hypothetical protein